MTLGDVIAGADLVISTVGGERGGGSGDLVEQGADLDAVVHLPGGERGDGDLARFGIEAGVQLAPRHIGLDADTGQVVAATLTIKDVDDGAGVGAFRSSTGTSGAVHSRRRV